MLSAVLAAAVAGCASQTPRLDSQWLAPQLPAAMRGARVLVACDVHDATMRRVCQDQVAAQVAAQGATPVVGPDIAGAPGQPVADAQYLSAARAAGASVVLATSIGLADTRVSPGVMLGIGGFGIGSGRVRGGLGMSVPIGGGEVSHGYSANGRVTDTASGRLLWMGTASTPPSGDFNSQMAGLARTVVDAARRAGLF
jgi:hypothetical protein